MSNGVELQCNGPSSSTESDFEGIVEIDSNYTLHVMHWESGNQAQVVTKDFSKFRLIPRDNEAKFLESIA